MKKHRQLIGIFLVLSMIAFGAAYQWLGPGLIVTDYPVTPPQAAAQGITIAERTSYHFALAPLVILGIVGVVLSMIPKRETPSTGKQQ
jgi:hypothetical protein